MKRGKYSSLVIPENYPETTDVHILPGVGSENILSKNIFFEKIIGKIIFKNISSRSIFEDPFSRNISENLFSEDIFENIFSKVINIEERTDVAEQPSNIPSVSNICQVTTNKRPFEISHNNLNACTSNIFSKPWFYQSSAELICTRP